MRSRSQMITTANMHTDMIIRKKTIRIWTIISVCFLGLYSTSCDSEEFPGKDKDTANIALRFAASISDNPSTKTTNGPDIITGTAFIDGTHTFGMFIARQDGTALVTGSNDNMKSTLNQSGNAQTWTHSDKNDSPLSLSAKNGEFINLTGYYPWITDATATSVPFDLTGDVASWKDLLYLSSPTGAQQVFDGSTIALTFSHAYCWVTVKLSKLTDKNDVPVKAVSIESSYSSKEGIMNKGTINPKTGDVVKGTVGPLTINCNPLVDIPLEGNLSGISPSEFHFLVPSFKNPDIKDSDIVIRVTTETNNGVIEVLSFPLTKTHLNHFESQYGFQKGMHNTYNIVYNNSEMILSLSGWQETMIESPTLGGGVAGTPVVVDISRMGISASLLNPSNHIYHTYLGEVAENNNGKYMTLEVTGNPLLFAGWEPFLKGEAVYPKMMVARNLGAGGAPVPWKDEATGALTAKQACVELRDGGYKDWRLPRVGELFIFAYLTPDEINSQADQLWGGTEYDADNCYSTNKSRNDGWIFPIKTSKNENLYVRCVRDYNKSKPTI